MLKFTTGQLFAKSNIARKVCFLFVFCSSSSSDQSGNALDSRFDQSVSCLHQCRAWKATFFARSVFSSCSQLFFFTSFFSLLCRKQNSIDRKLGCNNGLFFSLLWPPSSLLCHFLLFWNLICCFLFSFACRINLIRSIFQTMISRSLIIFQFWNDCDVFLLVIIASRKYQSTCTNGSRISKYWLSQITKLHHSLILSLSFVCLLLLHPGSRSDQKRKVIEKEKDKTEEGGKETADKQTYRVANQVWFNNTDTAAMCFPIHLHPSLCFCFHSWPRFLCPCSVSACSRLERVSFLGNPVVFVFPTIVSSWLQKFLG